MALVAFAGATVIGLATSSAAARRRARHRPLPGRRRRVRGRGRAAETRRARHSRADGHPARLPRRGGRAPAVRTAAGRRPRDGDARIAGVARVPRRLPDGHRVHDVGVRPQPDDGRPPRIDDLPGPGDRHRAGLVRAWEIPPIAALVGGAIAIGGVVIARSRPPDPQPHRSRPPRHADSAATSRHTRGSGARWRRG